jgi:hypothetical protein
VWRTIQGNIEMPFDVHWFDEAHTILEITVYGHPTWDEYHDAIDKVAKELKASPHRLDMVLDDKVGMPPGNPMPHLKAAIDKLIQYPNLGMSMAVSARNVALFPSLMMETAGRLYNIDLKRYGRFIKSMDEAVAIIQADRAKSTESD